MSRIGNDLAKVKATLVAAMPHRIITGSYREPADWPLTELQKGAVTVMLFDASGFDKTTHAETDAGDLSLMFIGYIQLTEGSTGSEVQEAELTLFEEVMDALQLDSTTCGIDVKSMKLSRQLDNPFGWFVCQADWVNFS